MALYSSGKCYLSKANSPRVSRKRRVYNLFNFYSLVTQSYDFTSSLYFNARATRELVQFSTVFGAINIKVVKESAFKESVGKLVIAMSTAERPFVSCGEKIIFLPKCISQIPFDLVSRSLLAPVIVFAGHFPSKFSPISNCLQRHLYPLHRWLTLSLSPSFTQVQLTTCTSVLTIVTRMPLLLVLASV